MWPFKKKPDPLIPIKESIGKLASEDGQLSHRCDQLSANIKNAALNITHLLTVLNLRIDSLTKEMGNTQTLFEGNLQKAISQLEEFLGIISYSKTQDNRVLFSESGILKFVLDSIKQLNYQMKKCDCNKKS